jgi:hypothetical protein
VLRRRRDGHRSRRDDDGGGLNRSHHSTKETWPIDWRRATIRRLNSPESLGRGRTGILVLCGAWDLCGKVGNRVPDLYSQAARKGGQWCLCGEREQDKDGGSRYFRYRGRRARGVRP